MADPAEPPEQEPDQGSEPNDSDRSEPNDGSADVDTLRRKVEEKYDFANFTPADMAEMTVEEWEAAFDSGSWITGPALLDRVEAELRSRVASREVFAVVERTEVAGTERVLAYTDAGYAMVGPDGTVEGTGSVLEDVEPVVALCSMASFEVAEPPADAGLPDPATVADGSGGLGDRLVLAVAGAQVVAGLALLAAPLVVDLNPGGGAGGATLLTTVAGLGFLLIGLVLGVLVANARLSGRFRAEEYRRRLEAAGVGSDERPPFLPGEGGGNDGETPGGEAAGGPGDEAAEPAPD